VSSVKRTPGLGDFEGGGGEVTISWVAEVGASLSSSKSSSRAVVGLSGGCSCQFGGLPTCCGVFYLVRGRFFRHVYLFKCVDGFKETVQVVFKLCVEEALLWSSTWSLRGSPRMKSQPQKRMRRMRHDECAKTVDPCYITCISCLPKYLVGSERPGNLTCTHPRILWPLERYTSWNINGAMLHHRPNAVWSIGI